MDSFKSLIETHLRANRVEKERRRTRGKLIKAYKNKDPSELYTLRINYNNFGEEVDKGTDIFNQLLNDLDKVDFINDTYTSDNYSEFIDNMHSDSSATESQQEEVIKFYNQDNNNTNSNSPAITDKDNDISFEIEPETQQQQNTEPQLDLLNNSVPVTDHFVVDEKQFQIEHEPAVVNDSNDIYDDNSVISAPEIYKPSKIGKVRSGKYKYGGKGFEVFTSYRNKCKPIYSSTLLFCSETCNGNEDELKKYLIEYGKFNNKMIEEIIFKTRGYYERYALIKVRGQLNYIKKKIKNMNKTKGNILNIFKRSRVTSASDWVNMNNILFVNSFDILKKDTHKKFTKLFLRYGDLLKDIKMGLDSNRDPYAVVHFKDLQDAKQCFQSEVVFGGKVLNIKFSKF